MNKPLAIGLIIFFILVIAGGAIWLTMRPAEEPTTTERGTILRFPFGLFGGGEEEPVTTTPTPTEEGEKPALLLLDSGPIESFTPTQKGVRYISKQNGHVSEIGPRGEEQTRVSNTTITGIFDSAWSPNASKAVLRYLESGNTRTVSAEFVSTSTRAVVLPQNIISFAFAPDRNRIAYLVPTSAGSRLIAADPDNTKQTETTNLPFNDFDIFWPENNFVYFLSRPSGSAGGFLFRYSISAGTLDKILDNLAGLQIKFSADGQKLVYSAYDSQFRQPRLYVYNLKTKETANIQLLGLADKCVFSKNNQNKIYCGLDRNLPASLYPDDWMRGAVSTNDLVWEIDSAGGQRKQLADRGFDIEQVALSEDGKFLYFTEKNNGSLWSLRIVN